ncbi:MAG TPA: hypothetical protein VF339_10265 [Gammaproteobacteria bacterium]
MSRAGVVLVLAAVPLLAFAADANAQSGFGGDTDVADCAARLRAGDGTGGEGGAPRLVDVCADLAREIEAGKWAPALGRTPAGALTARPFEDLVDLIAHYERVPDRTDLEVDELEALVDSLRPFEPVAELSLWERIREWLRERLGLDDAGGAGGVLEWLRNLSIPGEWVRALVYLLGFAIVIAALIVAANELRISGVLRGGRDRRRGRAAGGVPPWATRVPVTFDGVKRAPAVRQPALLLALVVERLKERFGDRVRDSLTHRELVAAAARLGVRRRDELEAVVVAAERVTFADWHPGPADVEPVIAHGKAVLDELDAGRPPGTASGR